MSRGQVLAGVLLTTLLWTGPSLAAAFKDGQDLKRYCAEDASHAEQAACFAYILGIADLLAGHDVKGFEVCFPADADLRKIVAKTGSYLDAHPERLDYPPNELVLDALVEAFPCMR